ncbi:hypothetical protein LTR36_004794 [Oleoguttula mirabilis]|uniref:Uncharacterized protein n=1 Tax=Oleoguttula mirabilis TaxID=1507867 RepID=A0AAV9JEY9_9PEZI|nr:hypothetical protein LTR36_004794 [Oleoguttula mirabilis]
MSSPPANIAAASSVVRNALATPPSRDSHIEPHPSHLPPSPPLSPKRRVQSTVDRLISILRLHKAGKPQQATESESDWRTFRLSPHEFAELGERLEREEEGLRGWYEDRVRYDYEPRAAGGEYVLRMPSATHEGFIARVEDGIARAIAALVERLGGGGSGDGEGDDDVKAAGCVREVYKGRSTTLELHAPELENSSQETRASGVEGEGDVVVRRSPDATFYHPAQPHLPTTVLEVSYSQSRKDLLRLAESYIVDSRHAVRCVIGLDIPYTSPVGKRSRRDSAKKNAAAPGPKGEDRVATLSIWRPGTETNDEGDEVGICRLDIDTVPFRNADGSACEGAFNLSIADVLPPSVSSTLPPSATSESISIPFSTLASFLTAAETSTSASASATAATSTVSSSAAPTKFRKRKRTPSEELSSGREEEYKRQEEADLEKEGSADWDWRARSRRRRLAAGHDAGRDVELNVEVVVPERRRGLRRRGSGRSVGGAS